MCLSLSNKNDDLGYHHSILETCHVSLLDTAMKLKVCEFEIVIAFIISYLLSVDFNGLIRLVDLIDYKRTVCSDTWRVIMDMVTQYKDRKLRLAFFNSTPQGGGGKVEAYNCITTMLTSAFKTNSGVDASCSPSTLSLIRCGGSL